MNVESDLVSVNPTHSNWYSGISLLLLEHVKMPHASLQSWTPNSSCSSSSVLSALRCQPRCKLLQTSCSALLLSVRLLGSLPSAVLSIHILKKHLPFLSHLLPLLSLLPFAHILALFCLPFSRCHWHLATTVRDTSNVSNALSHSYFWRVVLI